MDAATLAKILACAQENVGTGTTTTSGSVSSLSEPSANQCSTLESGVSFGTKSTPDKVAIMDNNTPIPIQVGGTSLETRKHVAKLLAQQETPGKPAASEGTNDMFSRASDSSSAIVKSRDKENQRNGKNEARGKKRNAHGKSLAAMRKGRSGRKAGATMESESSDEEESEEEDPSSDTSGKPKAKKQSKPSLHISKIDDSDDDDDTKLADDEVRENPKQKTQQLMQSCQRRSVPKRMPSATTMTRSPLFWRLARVTLPSVICLTTTMRFASVSNVVRAFRMRQIQKYTNAM